MGREVVLNALPTESRLFDLINEKKIDADLLTFVSSYFFYRRQQGQRVHEFADEDDKQYELFIDTLEEIVDNHPGIENRYCDLERRFDWLKWLLIECSCDEEEKTLAIITVEGESLFIPAASGVQGFPIRWTVPDTCKLIHIWLTGLDESYLQSKYSPSQMSDTYLYKWNTENDAEESFRMITKDFQALKQLYQNVTNTSEAILVVTD
jgi:Domain of unknown function (DUF1877)